jgi:hypothetical protein
MNKTNEKTGALKQHNGAVAPDSEHSNGERKRKRKSPASAAQKNAAKYKRLKAAAALPDVTA